jgi:hypothetical protein
MNNGGIYHGDCDDADEWLKLQEKSREGHAGLRSTSLGYQVGYEKMAEMCGGKGFLVHTPEELERATEEGFKANVPVVVNVIIESGAGSKLVSSLFAQRLGLRLTIGRSLLGKRVRRKRVSRCGGSRLDGTFKVQNFFY